MKAQRPAIIWGRFSSSKQEDGDSRERQNRLNRALAKRLGIKVIAEHFDPAASVKEGATPLFKKIIADLPHRVVLGNPNPERSLRKAVEANIKRKQEFAAAALKSIREIQSTGVETLSRIADCMNKRGEKTPRGGSWTATAVKRVLECVA